MAVKGPACLGLTGFREIAVWSGLEQVGIRMCRNLLQAIKRIGAGLRGPPSGGGLGGAGCCMRCAVYCERFGTPGGVPVSYTVIYATGRR